MQATAFPSTRTNIESEQNFFQKVSSSFETMIDKINQIAEVSLNFLKKLPGHLTKSLVLIKSDPSELARTLKLTLTFMVIHSGPIHSTLESTMTIMNLFSPLFYVKYFGLGDYKEDLKKKQEQQVLGYGCLGLADLCLIPMCLEKLGLISMGNTAVSLGTVSLFGTACILPSLNTLSMLSLGGAYVLLAAQSIKNFRSKDEQGLIKGFTEKEERIQASLDLLKWSFSIAAIIPGAPPLILGSIASVFGLISFLYRNHKQG